ncbi:hypothetical protein Cva_00111 [Caedimonas varicaedens]|uniref:Uncharacterized protein n=1 Tax=Caedimonas varicaedens TaxID=1629334 RepID=A0A0K8MC88_9PROT|nr:hypothetical protein Cva_00111 [Caedimonas varicaedens]
MAQIENFTEPIIFEQGVSDVYLPENERAKLHATVGHLKVESDFLGRALGRNR